VETKLDSSDEIEVIAAGLGVVITSNNVNLQENLALEALPRNTYDGKETLILRVITI